MKKFTAPTLQNALIQASEALNCSVVDLEYEVLQHPSPGLLGIGKKQAVIIANRKTPPKESQNSKFTPEMVKVQEHCKIIQEELRELLACMPYEIDAIEVTPYDHQTLFIFLDGEDSPLLIGENGYRYRAFSYMLFYWVHFRYGYNIRLEVARFLQMQEEMVDQYMRSIHPYIEHSKHFKTKKLNGTSAFLLLKRLREKYPGKYISIKQEENEQYILIRSFE
ncbi:Jag N-terminal domain-containing protein [Helicobacter mustelae]|uniref:RNA-binding protein KhpB N-terminal domain-containing protein n=1 Tax=Helicobacter mustelae (strain ATCC 43772 / CCUG 25715 / CIP 103759 / LMG 18044 / NCTC 12198 / R85-136P) TaxID=679897 RepID=D3UI80_HELM1|nr:Jag N-terminal domain-containing protein [Helicobacter mustelae]CBG40203.1 Putative hypothetical protein [Helicobacter mustelae 12198]SQH71703.1 VirB11-interacting protein [Helicobacter mustelae]STP12829.1 VirB11-interacting protein [Helicobacter mustelae]